MSAPKFKKIGKISPVKVPLICYAYSKNQEQENDLQILNTISKLIFEPLI